MSVLRPDPSPGGASGLEQLYRQELDGLVRTTRAIVCSAEQSRTWPRTPSSSPTGGATRSSTSIGQACGCDGWPSTSP